MGLAFTDILNYLDQKKSNPHKQFREKKLLGFFFDFFFFLAEYALLNILFTTTIYPERKILSLLYFLKQLATSLPSALVDF